MTAPKTVIVYRIDDAIIRDIDRELRSFGKIGEQGVIRARNRTAQFVRTQGQREVRKRLALPAAYVRDRVLITQATLADPAARVRVPRRQTLLSRFSYRQLTKRMKVDGETVQRDSGVRVRIRPGTSKVIPSAFTVPLKGGNGTGIAVRLDVLRRLGKKVDNSATGGDGRRRYEVLHTSSIRDAFADGYPEIRPAVQDFYQKQTERELANAIRRTQGRSAGGAS